MRKPFMLWLIVLLLALLFAWASADSFVVEVTKATSIRTEANYNAGKVRLAQPGELFVCTGEAGKWYRIYYDGTSEGYLPQDVCRVSTSADAASLLDPLVPYGITCSEGGQYIPVFDAVNSNNKIDLLNPDQLCALDYSDLQGKYYWHHMPIR